MQSSVRVIGMAPKISLFNSVWDRNRSLPIRFLPDLSARFFHRKSVESALNRSNSDKISVQSAGFSKFGPIHSESKYVIWPKPFNSCEMSRKTLHPIQESTKQFSTKKVQVSDPNRPIPTNSSDFDFKINKPTPAPTPTPINAIRPVFTETFNLTREAGSYKSFIERLRSRLASDASASGVPMLNREQDGRNRWFDIVLVSGNSQITVRFRYGDLYLAAFQGANGRWYQFQHQRNRPPLFSNSVELPYTDDYPVRASLGQTVVGAESLDRAISSLAHRNFNPNDWINRELLISLMVMLSEAIRFREVSDFVYARIHDPETPDSQIGARIAELVHNWGVLSFQMRRSDLFATFGELAALSINSAVQAAMLLGILLWSRKTPPKSAVITNSVNDVVTSKGRQLVEIFWVKILNIDNENPGDLYGKIKVVDGFDKPEYIFDRTKENYLSIRPQEYVPLTGPTRAMSAFDSFYIDVYLMDYDTESFDDEVSRGRIIWNYFGDNVYDQPLLEEVKGKYGSIALSYAVYSNAVTATVQVKLINGDNENPANVYGTIKASNTFANQSITLFNKDNKSYVDIKPLQLIPLLRSVVVVPLTSSINVGADLWDQDTLSPDDPIAQGSITFLAAASGSNIGRIRGKYGEVEVTVTWSSSWA